MVSDLIGECNAWRSGVLRWSIVGPFEDAADAGIVSPPAETRRTTRMYLASRSARRVQRLLRTLKVRVVDGDIGSASASKMAFAAWTKGTSALPLTVNAVAASEIVLDDPLQRAGDVDARATRAQ